MTYIDIYLFPPPLCMHMQLRNEVSDAMDRQKEAERERESAELRVLEVHIPNAIYLLYDVLL